MNDTDTMHSIYNTQKKKFFQTSNNSCSERDLLTPGSTKDLTVNIPKVTILNNHLDIHGNN